MMEFIAVSRDIIAEYMSNKADRKEHKVKKKNIAAPGPGKYLNRADREALQRQRRSSAIKRIRRKMTVTVLLLWDGLLLYMIVRCLIDGVYGAVFMAVVSVTLGYHMK